MATSDGDSDDDSVLMRQVQAIIIMPEPATLQHRHRIMAAADMQDCVTRVEPHAARMVCQLLLAVDCAFYLSPETADFESMIAAAQPTIPCLTGLVSTAESKGADDGRCAICHGEFVQPVQVDGCCHVFCTHCLGRCYDARLRGLVSCPMCRQQVTAVHLLPGTRRPSSLFHQQPIGMGWVAVSEMMAQTVLLQLESLERPAGHRLVIETGRFQSTYDALKMVLGDHFNLVRKWDGSEADEVWFLDGMPEEMEGIPRSRVFLTEGGLAHFLWENGRSGLREGESMLNCYSLWCELRDPASELHGVIQRVRDTAMRLSPGVTDGRLDRLLGEIRYAGEHEFRMGMGLRVLHYSREIMITGPGGVEYSYDQVDDVFVGSWLALFAGLA